MIDDCKRRGDELINIVNRRNMAGRLYGSVRRRPWLIERENGKNMAGRLYGVVEFTTLNYCFETIRNNSFFSKKVGIVSCF